MATSGTRNNLQRLATFERACCAQFPRSPGLVWLGAERFSLAEDTLLSVARWMRLSRQLGCFSLALAAVVEGPAEASVGKQAESTESLLQKLQNQVVYFSKNRRLGPVRTLLGDAMYPHSKESVDFIEATARLVLGDLAGFRQCYDDCLEVLEVLIKALFGAGPGVPHATTDYWGRHQDPGFLDCLGTSYLGVIRDFAMVGLCHESNDSFGALSKFLEYSFKAQRMRCEVGMYHEHILRAGPEVFLSGQGEMTVSQTVERGENFFKRDVCADYDALVKQMIELFHQMAEEFEGILDGLEDTYRVTAYECLKNGLEVTFRPLFGKYPDELERLAIGFKTDLCDEPSKILALAQVLILWKLSNLKLRFPMMDHSGPHHFRLFLRDESAGYCGNFYYSPNLIRGDALMDGLKDPGKDDAFFFIRFRGVFKELRVWAYSLYDVLQPDSMVRVPHEKAKEWLGKVEGKLSLVLDAIGSIDGKRKLYALASIVEHWYYIMRDMERVRMVLYGKIQSEGKSESASLLLKLEQVIRDACPLFESIFKVGSGGCTSQGSDCSVNANPDIIMADCNS